MDPRRAALFPMVPSPVPPLAIERTDGVWLIRDTGQRILDAGGGAIVTNVGHGRVDVADAAKSALTDVGYVVPLWATEQRVALVEELLSTGCPKDLPKLASSAEAANRSTLLSDSPALIISRPVKPTAGR